MTAPGSPAAPTSPLAPGYPPAQRLGLTEDLLGHRVADPYRWLEDAASPQTRDWLAAQDGLARGQLDALPGRAALASRIGQLMAAGYISAPVWRGERQFFVRRLAGQEHGVLLTAAPGEPERVLVDPMALDPSGGSTLDAWQPDKEGRLLAYQISSGGDEESLLRVLDVASGADVDGPISRTRYSAVAWLPGGDAFYYVRKLPPGDVPPGEEQFHRRVYLHAVGQAASDVLIFGDGLDKTNYYGVSVSRDGRWLVVSAAQGTAPRNDLWLADLTAAPLAAPGLREVQAGVDARTSLHVGRDGRLYVFTDSGAPRGRLAVADPAEPGPASWRDLIPEDPAAVLSDYAILDGAELDRPVLLAAWTRHAISEITVHDLATGERAGRLALPGPGGTGGTSRARHHRRHQCPAGGRPRGLVRLHRQHHAGDHPALRRAHRGGQRVGPCARRGDRPGHPHRAGDVPVRGRHRRPHAGHQPGRRDRPPPARPAPAGHPLRLRRFRHQHGPGLLGHDPGLGGGRRGVRDRLAARRR